MRIVPFSLLLLSALSQQPGAQCTKDTDCKGDRICVEGTCVEPTGNTALTTTSQTKGQSPGQPPARMLIRVSPNKAKVFVDGESLGNGDTVIEVSPGLHEYHAEYGGRISRTKTERFAYGEAEKVYVFAVPKDIKLRNMMFHVGGGLGASVGTFGVVGFTGSLGAEIIRKHYVGLTAIALSQQLWYDWETVDQTYDYTGLCVVSSRELDDLESHLFGLGLEYGYVFNVKDILLVLPGVTVGLWDEQLSVDWSGQMTCPAYTGYGSVDSGFREWLYWGGPKLKVLVGPKRLFFGLDLALLLGRAVWGGDGFATRALLGASIIGRF